MRAASHIEKWPPHDPEAGSYFVDAPNAALLREAATALLVSDALGAKYDLLLKAHAQLEGLYREAIEKRAASDALIRRAGEVVTSTIGPLEYAYNHVSSVTADEVKGKILPAARTLAADIEERKE